MSARTIQLATWLAAFVGGALLSDSARAQSPAGDECVLPRESSGLIRGDRVPTGCVMVERAADEAASPPMVLSGHGVILVPVVVGSPLFVVGLVGPPFVGVGIPRRPGAGTGADSLPRVRSGAFGPILRPFGPVTQPFRPTNRHFDVVARARAPAPDSSRAPR